MFASLNSFVPSVSLVLLNVYTVTPDLRPVNEEVMEANVHIQHVYRLTEWDQFHNQQLIM